MSYLEPLSCSSITNVYSDFMNLAIRAERLPYVTCSAEYGNLMSFDNPKNILGSSIILPAQHFIQSDLEGRNFSGYGSAMELCMKLMFLPFHTTKIIIFFPTNL
jgi:hypothetical protein